MDKVQCSTCTEYPISGHRMSDDYGCQMASDKNVEVFAEVIDTTGNHRLVLNLVQVLLPNAPQNQRAFDFHSLVWETKEVGGWIVKMRIMRSDFQSDFEYRRWINNIHSFVPDTGRATIKVGEEGPRDEAGVMRVTYSWREWDLIGNKEVRTLRVCNRPFEELETL